MKKYLRATGLLAVLLMVIWLIACSGGGSSGGGGNYSINDLIAVWLDHGTEASDAPNQPKWWHQTVTFAANLITFTNYVDSTNGAGSAPINNTLQVSGDGIVTDTSNANFVGVMNALKNFVVFTNGNNNRATMDILLKTAGTTYTAADLVGNWYLYGLGTGDGVNINNWFYGTAAIDNTGLFTRTITATSLGVVPPAITPANNVICNIAADGTVTFAGTNVPHGTMSTDKNMIVMTNTLPNGSFGLMVYVKQGTTYTQADGAGTWRIHGLGASDGGNFWVYGTLTVDATGNTSPTTWTTPGGPSNGAAGTVTIQNNGLLTTNTGENGVLSADKNIMIMVGTGGNNEPQLFVGVKR